VLRFEWDPAKNESNRKKHSIDFEAARNVFDDPLHIAFIDAVIDNEQRWIAIGSIEGVITVVVVHTYRQDGSDKVIRIISARPTTSHERKLYVQALHS
jgi:uncharacterized protein